MLGEIGFKEVVTLLFGVILLLIIFGLFSIICDVGVTIWFETNI
jgi:hypothetical protein